ncbi:MAG: 30S ribosomal protein S2 [Deltaproteobacteria bacterium]|nr:30S ribosomal protein S2 [Deltaproteobacteria bacterium]
MTQVSIPEMMEAGAHFGHQTKRWNPKMRPYIYGSRSGVHIIDLQKTHDLANEALQFIQETVAKGGDVLFVGTKQQAREAVKEHAGRSKMHYVNQRWMGGTLTNFKTIKNSIDRLLDLESRREKDQFEGYTKRELLDIDRTIEKLEASLGGIRNLNGFPRVVFVVDPKHEHIAIREARKLGLTVIALTDTNCDPDPVDHVIPANDDAISTIEYFASKVADACLAGLEKRQENARKASGDTKPQTEKKARRVSDGTEADKKAAYVGKRAKTEEEAKEGDGSVEGYSAKAEKEEAIADKAKDAAVATG